MAQLKFRKVVLKQKCDDSKVFNISRSVDGKQKRLTIEEIKANLMSLIPAAAMDATCESVHGAPETPHLVGKRINHTFEDGKRYRGRVISVVPGFPDWYGVVYQGDEAVYTYKLLDDYAAGDLCKVHTAPEDDDTPDSPSDKV